jgi:hypothetical protein
MQILFFPNAAAAAAAAAAAQMQIKCKFVAASGAAREV